MIKLVDNPTVSNPWFRSSMRWRLRDDTDTVLRSLLNSTLSSSGNACYQRLRCFMSLPSKTALQTTLHNNLVPWPAHQSYGEEVMKSVVAQIAKLCLKDPKHCISFVPTHKSDDTTNFPIYQLMLVLASDETDLCNQRVMQFIKFLISVNNIYIFSAG